MDNLSDERLLESLPSYRSITPFISDKKQCAEMLLILHEARLFGVVKDGDIYKFPLDEEEYSLIFEGNFEGNDLDEIIFSKSSDLDKPITDDKFYQKLFHAFVEENQALLLAVQNNKYDLVEKLLEMEAFPFYELPDEVANGRKYSDDQAILDLIDKYKIIWIVPQVREKEIKEIDPKKFAAIAVMEGCEACFSAMSKLYNHVMIEDTAEIGGKKIGAIKMARIWSGEEVDGGVSLSEEERELIVRTFANEDFSFYDEDKLAEDQFLKGFEQDTAKIMSAIRNIFDEKNFAEFSLVAEKSASSPSTSFSAAGASAAQGASVARAAAARAP